MRKHRQQRKAMKKINAMLLVARCPNCDEEVRVGISKRQIMAMAKAFREGRSEIEMEKIAEAELGRHPKTGELNL